VSVFHNPPGGTPHKGTLIQLAPKDVLFRTTQSFSAGTMLNLHLVAEHLGLETVSLGMVHWCVEENDAIQCGVFLGHALPQEWVDYYWDDLRKEVRFNGQWLLRAWTTDPEERVDVVVGNYSRNGVHFMTRHCMRAEEKICLGAPDNFVKAEVRWCLEADRDCYRVGCELERDSGVRLASLLRFSAFDL
jgi:hypothetical protein